jgi:hypothetical protein
MVKSDILIMGIQQSEEIFSTVGTNLSAWPNIMGLGTRNVSAERRKSENCCNLIFACLTTTQEDEICRANMLAGTP